MVNENLVNENPDGFLFLSNPMGLSPFLYDL